MKVSLIAVAGGIAGLSWIAISTSRWFFIYPDMSQWLLSLLIGVGMLYASYVYNFMRAVDRRFLEQDNRIDIIGEKVFHIKPEDKITFDKIDARKYVS